MAKKEVKKELPETIELQASFLERFVIGQVLFNPQFPVVSGKEISQFLRLKEVLVLSEIEDFINSNVGKEQLQFNKEQVSNKTKYVLPKHLVEYIKEKVLPHLSLTGITANTTSAFFKQVFDAVGYPEG